MKKSKIIFAGILVCIAVATVSCDKEMKRWKRKYGYTTTTGGTTYGTTTNGTTSKDTFRTTDNGTTDGGSTDGGSTTSNDTFRTDF